MSLLHVFGFGLRVGHLLWMLCCWIIYVISMKWFLNSGIMDTKTGLLGDGGKMCLKWWEKISGNVFKIHHHYYQSIGSKRVRKRLWKRVVFAWVLCWTFASLWIFWYMSSQATEKRKETLASMCDERARMLQDQFNVSMNHVQAMSILISTFHHGKNPSAIDQVAGSRFILEELKIFIQLQFINLFFIMSFGQEWYSLFVELNSVPEFCFYALNWVSWDAYNRLAIHYYYFFFVALIVAFFFILGFRPICKLGEFFRGLCSKC